MIQRLSNGTWKFLYGKNPKNSSRPYPPVEMYIFGSLKMRCLSNKCGMMNTFNFFPGRTMDEEIAIVNNEISGNTNTNNNDRKE